MENEMADDSVVAPKLEQAQSKGPGSRLREARLAKGLTLEEVARKLFLTTTVVSQIENDEYQKAPAVAFMRGYLRSYARLVDSDSEAIIQEFNSLGLTDNPANMSTQRIYKKRNSWIAKIGVWVAGGIVVILLLLILMWARWEFSHSSVELASSNNALSGIDITDNSGHHVVAPLTPDVTITHLASPKDTVNSSLDVEHKTLLASKDKQHTKHKVQMHKKAQIYSPF